MLLILVTGGHGFVGVNLLQELSREFKNRTILVIDRKGIPEVLKTFYSQPGRFFLQTDLCSIETVRSYIDNLREEIEVIFNLAANSDISTASKDSRLDFNDTLNSTTALLEAVAHLIGMNSTIVHASTSAVFGIQSKPLSARSDLMKIPVSYYGWAKLAVEYMLEGFAQIKSCGLHIVRFPNVVGPYLTHGLIFDLHRKFNEGNFPLQMLGNGRQSKPYLHISQLIPVLVKLSLVHNLRQILHVGPTDSVSVSQIVNSYMKIRGIDFPVVYQDSDTGWPGDVPKYLYGEDQIANLVFAELGIKLFSSIEAVSLAIREL